MSLFDTIQTEFVQMLKNSGQEVEIIEVGDTENNWYLELKVNEMILKLEDISEEAGLISVRDQVDILNEMMVKTCSGDCKCKGPDLKTYIQQNRAAKRY